MFPRRLAGAAAAPGGRAEGLRDRSGRPRPEVHDVRTAAGGCVQHPTRPAAETEAGRSLQSGGGCPPITPLGSSPCIQLFLLGRKQRRGYF